MFIKNLELKNYYMFSDNVINFKCPKKNKKNTLNVLIGYNGTGKTKILEKIYNDITGEEIEESKRIIPCNPKGIYFKPSYLRVEESLINREVINGEKILDITNSLIIIDYPEISLDLEYQSRYIETLKKIGSNNQFIIATHSAIILQYTQPEDHIIILAFDEDHNMQIRYKPKFIERDMNSISELLMGFVILPMQVLELRMKYRGFFDKGEEESIEAQEVKEELLKYESLESSFFQEIDFLRDLRLAGFNLKNNI